MSRSPVTLKQIVAEFDAPTPDEQEAELARLDRDAAEEEEAERHNEDLRQKQHELDAERYDSARGWRR